MSQVNEILAGLETHPLPFACTTNLPDRLGQAKTLFGRIFGNEVPPDLARLAPLIPADLSRVTRKISVLDLVLDASSSLALFITEVEGREGISRPIGFTVTEKSLRETYIGGPSSDRSKCTCRPTAYTALC
jgi:hypothetical protein